MVCLRYQALWMLRRAIQGRAECPICRAPLKPGDLFDAATAEEEESQRLLNENMGNYGAKVPSSDPWPSIMGGRLLKPVQLCCISVHLC